MKVTEKDREIRQRVNDPAFIQMLQQHPLILSKATLAKESVNNSSAEKKH